MTFFSAENTSGYSEDDLDELNDAFDRAVSAYPGLDPDDPDETLDHFAERLLAGFDDGLRGDELIALAIRRVGLSRRD